MTRRADWEARLHAYLAEASGKPHVYGRHDCMTFVAGVVRALTGDDPARGHRGRYTSATSSLRYLKGLGFKNVAAMIDSVLPQKPVMMAGRGDIVLDNDGIPGVCIGGDAVMVGQAEDAEGLVRVPRSHWARAWHV